MPAPRRPRRAIAPPRNKIAAAGLEGARKAKPAAFFSPRFDTLVTVGNLEDDLAAAAASCDVIIEAIIENLAIKQKLYARLDEMGGRRHHHLEHLGPAHRRPDAGAQPDFRGRFCITHFFNPPRYMKLVEIVAGRRHRRPRRSRAPRRCAAGMLGKGLVRAKDTPNFIANRIGTFALMRTLDEAVKPRATPSRRSTWSSARPPGGRRAPCSAPPTSSAWTRCCTSPSNCYDALTDDERRDVFKPPAVLQQLVEKKWLGAKTNRASTRRSGDDILQLDLKTLEYGPQKKPRFDSIGATRGVDDVDEKTAAHGGGQTTAPPRWRARCSTRR